MEIVQPRKSSRVLCITVLRHGAAENEKIELRIPLDLLEAGMPLTAAIPGSVRETLEQALLERGLQEPLTALSVDRLISIFSSEAGSIETPPGSAANSIRIFKDQNM